MDRRYIALAVIVAAAGCSSSTGPFSQLSASNNPDDFLFIAQTFGQAATTTLNYTWVHNSPVGQIAQGTAVPGALTITPISGTASIEVKDASGNTVWTHDLKESISDTTMTGVPGNWTINLSFTNANGDILFELKRAPRDLVVVTNTSGTNKDSVFTATLDEAATQALTGSGGNNNVVFSNVSPAEHSVKLTGVAANCTITDGDTRTTTVPATIPTPVTFNITCT